MHGHTAVLLVLVAAADTSARAAITSGCEGGLDALREAGAECVAAWRSIGGTREAGEEAVRRALRALEA